jgi:hypothetical protein
MILKLLMLPPLNTLKQYLFLFRKTENVNVMLTVNFILYLERQVCLSLCVDVLLMSNYMCMYYFLLIVNLNVLKNVILLHRCDDKLKQSRFDPKCLNTIIKHELYFHLEFVC